VPEPIDVARIAANMFAAGRKRRCGCSATLSSSSASAPTFQKRLREDRTLIPNFVEECLRIEGPVKGDFRLAKQPTSLGGVDIPAGTFLYIANSAANRDSRKFENPAEFQLGRSNARCIWHSAPAAMLAPVPPSRGGGVVSLNACSTGPATFVFGESPRPAGARRYSYLPTFILRGLTHIGLEFDPAVAG